MNIMKRICQAIIQSVKQGSFLPKTVTDVVKQRQRQALLNEHEVERLDRIRNPSKYLGQ